MNIQRAHSITRMLAVMDEPITIAQICERIHARPNTLRLWIIEALRKGQIEECGIVKSKRAGGSPMYYRRKVCNP